jgi:serine/threonine protein kinase
MQLNEIVDLAVGETVPGYKWSDGKLYDCKVKARGKANYVERKLWVGIGIGRSGGESLIGTLPSLSLDESESESSASHLLASTNCGTDVYAAPEIRARKTYHAGVDVYSLGIIVAECVIGTSALIKCGTKGRLTKLATKLRPISSVKLYSMVMDMIKQNPAERLKFPEFFSHPFLNEMDYVTRMLQIKGKFRGGGPPSPPPWVRH